MSKSKCTKHYKTHQVRSTFGSWDVGAVVARSTFRRQNVQNTPFSDHFWKLRCWKSARRFGAKHISKAKCTKHTILGALLDVQMSFHVASARDSAPRQRWAKREGFVAVSKALASVGHVKRTRDTWVRRVWRSGRWFPESGSILEHQIIKSSGLLRWFCVTGAALRMTWLHFFVAGAQNTLARGR